MQILERTSFGFDGPDDKLIDETAGKLWRRTKRADDQPGLDGLVDYFRALIKATPKHAPGYPTSVHGLSVTLHDRAEQQKDLRDLEEAISLKEEFFGEYPANCPTECM